MACDSHSGEAFCVLETPDAGLGTGGILSTARNAVIHAALFVVSGGPTGAHCILMIVPVAKPRGLPVRWDQPRLRTYECI